MLRGDSRSHILGSGGVDTFRFDIPEPAGGDDSTAPPDTERPFKPNGTGGFRTPAKIKQSECASKNFSHFYFRANLPIPNRGIAFPIISLAFNFF